MNAVPDGWMTNKDALDMIELAQRLQSAAAGNAELDARLDCFLTGRLFAEMETCRRYLWRTPGCEAVAGVAEPPTRWSEDMMALLRLMPGNHNFSMGERDGVVWAWIQPNDGWQPGAYEVRHDHPGGSGLVVAQTIPLAVAAAMVIVRMFPGGIRG